MIETDSNRDAVRLRSIRGKGAGAWLDSIPSSEKFALSSGNLVLAASLRLGLPLSLPPWVTKCECGKSLDVEGYHLLTCKMGGGPVWSHNSAVSCWSECLSSLQCQHQIKPKDRYTTSNNRADIVVFKLYRDEEGRNNPSDFKTHWRRRLSVQLQHYNASVLARKMMRVTYGQKAGQSLDVVQLSIQ